MKRWLARFPTYLVMPSLAIAVVVGHDLYLVCFTAHA